MPHIHKHEKEQFKKLFDQDHIDRFEDRLRVLEVFLQTERHVTAGELADLLARSGHAHGVDFVLDTLKMMHRYGFAQKNRFDNGELRYEHRHLGQHHDHMICTKCGGISEFENDDLERLQAEIASNHGFHMLQHRMEIYGICAECTRLRARIIPLTRAKPGERLVIREFSGGTKAQLRLISMGLRVDDPLEVITNQDQGQVVISADCKRYVLGRGLAQKVMAEPLEKGAVDDHAFECQDPEPI
jgi:Fur family transcriptional regulator, ferric uptake regulator